MIVVYYYISNFLPLMYLSVMVYDFHFYILTTVFILSLFFFFFFQAEDGIRDAQESRGLGDVYKRQPLTHATNNRGRLWGKSVLDSKPPLSLQASTAYDAVQAEERYTYSLNKAVAQKMHKGSGFAVRKPDAPKTEAPISIQDPYTAASGAFGKRSK
eukprot:TRINITY_DN17415_c0_g1_i3.p1 TRINITY_DN17415_c0_g1~~TRINITY_DN17415_c0_g1_i3.p1  ORF type:complete len:157 (-),score=30.53 TRINITY_DN17415_c0_g1_i3:405-875(-)